MFSDIGTIGKISLEFCVTKDTECAQCQKLLIMFTILYVEQFVRRFYLHIVYANLMVWDVILISDI